MMSTATPSVIPTDEEMDVWLQDMMYSGDLLGFVRRRARDVVTLDFVEYDWMGFYNDSSHSFPY
jgi:hypothetical protein